MLDSKTIAVVKSTVPLLAAAGSKLTAHFYDRLFLHHPELKNIFNMSNQFNGEQREALFNAIYSYASNIDNLAALLPAIEKIAQKHASLNIKPEHYPIVGQHLLATLDELLDPRQEVLDAWTKAYNVLANVFIQREEQIYSEAATSRGGWRTLRPFKIVRKERESDIICSFILKPVDNKEVIDFKPGQYLGIYIQHDSIEYQEIRQYSITNTPNGEYYRIAVKREEQGTVSNYLHNQATEDDIIHLAPPRGDFFLNITPEIPITLISAGIGQTPMLSMLNTLHANQHPSAIYWLHATENGRVHAFVNELTDLAKKMPNLVRHIWYREPTEQDISGTDYHYSGLMDFTRLKPMMLDSSMHYYLCGPLAFMQFTEKQLIVMGADEAQIYYECFGPHKVI